MKGNEFKRWALRGCRIYGDDDWFFLRELAQNARDAGARSVRVDASREGDEEVLTFHDDGAGMALSHAQEFLFRLYASSKEEEQGSAGQFGIGFWAVLRFSPRLLTIASNDGSGPWAVTIDEDFGLTRVESTQRDKGTTVTLRRPARYDSERDYLTRVRRALKRFCRYLRRNDRKASPLQVTLGDESMLEEMTLPGPLTLQFSGKGLEGVVGLGERPSVELFARGLPVWKGLLLDELSYRGADHNWRSEIAQGLAPVFLVNRNQLNVVMSRNAVVDDAALAALRRRAGKALGELVRHQLHATLPAGPWHRLWDGIRQLALAIGRIPLVVALPVIVAAIAAVSFWSYGDAVRQLVGWPDPSTGEAIDSPEPDSSSPPELLQPAPASGPAPGQLPTVYRGSVVDRLPSAQSLDLRYRPPEPQHFKYLTATEFQSERGFVATRHSGALAPYPAPDCSGPKTQVVVTLSGDGLIALPVPTGHALLPDSLERNGVMVARVERTPTHEPLVTVHDSGVFAYSTCPAAATPDPIPELSLELFGVVAGDGSIGLSDLAPASLDDRVSAIIALVRQRVVYDDSPEAARLYAALGPGVDWVEFVLDAGRGDCDVMNALVVLLLRESGVPARLAIGSVGRRGRVAAGLHAWAEYYDESTGRWRVADASDGEVSGVRRVPASRAANPESVVPPSPGPTPLAIDSTAPSTSTPRTTMPSAGDLATTPERLADEPKRPMAGVQAPDPQRASWHLWAVAAGALLLFLLLWRLLRAGGVGQVSGELQQTEAEELLGDMALSAASQPGAWAHAGILWRHPILPQLQGDRRLSLRRAERQAMGGRLFCGGHRSSGLAHKAAQSGTPVLDASHRAFGRLAGQLPGIIDLDRVDALEPQLETALSGRGLVSRANALLRKVGGARVPLVVCPGLVERRFLDVDLRRASLPPEWRPFKRFVAVRPDAELQRLAGTLGADASTALYELVDAVTRESRYYRREGRLIRAHCARRCLEDPS